MTLGLHRDFIITKGSVLKTLGEVCGSFNAVFILSERE